MNKIFMKAFGRRFFGYSKNTLGIVKALDETAVGNVKTRAIAKSVAKLRPTINRSRALRYKG